MSTPTPPRAPTRANGNRTRALILDAAERQFGARGFDAISLRDITDDAGVTLALASYHFGTKDNLFEAVVARRAGSLGQDRRDRLAALHAPDTRAILDAFMGPLFVKAQGSETGWTDYFRFLARLGESDRWLGILQRHFDATARLYVEALATALPQADRSSVARAFTMTLQVMLATVSQNGRIDQLSDGRVRARDLQSAYAALLTYASAGIDAVSR